ncbi:DUF6114 domain-containing protein [Nocardia sp. NPDC004068]|uniref:DUF6114 domain-containing protein n=1 Tax=Nocardia sp. NPDC004068 TaxID=3364303 RepID=UPI0036C038F2
MLLMRRGDFARWRRERPFLGGVLTSCGGLVVLALPTTLVAAEPRLPGTGGVANLLLGGLLSLLGPAIWFRPDRHGLLGIATVLLALAAFAYSNLGGLLIGTLAALLGGSLTFAWLPPRNPEAQPDEKT